MQECFPKHFRMRRVRMKEENETDEEKSENGKK